MTTATPTPGDKSVAQSIPPRPCGHPRATLAASILGSSLGFIDGSVVNVALPAMDRDLHAGADGLAWLVSAYLLSVSALTLLGGALGDRYGHRRIFLAGVSLFLVASIACATAPSLAVILGARALQGIGAALLMPNSLAILGASFEGEAKGQAIGTWAGVGALASALGPVLGGWLVEVIGWRSIFFINLPVGAAAVWLARRFVTESHDKRQGSRLDVSGAVLVTLTLGLLTWALSASALPGTSGAAITAAALIGVILIPVFLRVEIRRGSDALMPVFLMRERPFIAITLFTFLLYAALGGLIVLLPFVLIRGAGYSPVAAGTAMLPIPLLIGFGSATMGKIAAKSGGRRPLAMGALIVAFGFVLYTRIGPDSGYWLDVFPATLVVAIGMTICVAPLTTTVLKSVDANLVGVASGFNSAVARIGGLIATALLGFVLVDQDSSERLLASTHRAALVGAVLAGLASICALTLNRERSGQDSR